MALRRLSGEERSRAIVETAIGVFAREGFSGTTTRRLAHAAGVSEALLFRHFPNKKALYRAILETKLHDSEQALPIDAALRALDDETLLTRIAAHIIRRVDADDAFCRLMLFSAMEGHDMARRFHKARVGRLLELIEERVRRRRSAHGGIDPVLAARLFNGMILSATLARCVFREPGMVRATPERLARTIVRIFLDGIGSRREAS
jgi:AcrR family transcriptional regulator